MEWHPHAHAYPMIQGDEYDSFKGFIEIFHQFLEPIKVRFVGAKKQGLDGRTRFRACTELGIACPEEVVTVEDHECESYIDALNLNRRHLDKEGRQQKVFEMTRKGVSIRTIAKTVHASPSTVQRDQAEMEDRAEEPKKDKPRNGTPVETVKAPRKSMKNEVETSKPKDDSGAVVDDNDYTVPARLRPAFKMGLEFIELEYKLNALATRLRNLEIRPEYVKAAAAIDDRNSYSSFLLSAAKKLRDTRPAVLHDDCKSDGCTGCGGKGYLIACELPSEVNG